MEEGLHFDSSIGKSSRGGDVSGGEKIPNSQDNISSIIEAGREELLDLGLRNPLLNHRPSRARGIEISDELPRI